VAQESGILATVLPEIFNEFPKISVDYAIMEHAKAIYTIPGSFQWLDVGNWNALPMILPPDNEGNVHLGDIISLNSKNTIVSGSSDRLIALIGLQDLVVVDTGDILLVSARDKVADIKKVLEQLRNSGRSDKL
jgi:mannose-1-phosphate guanylyltransferase